MTMGTGDTKHRQNAGFQSLHDACVLICFMIITVEMQNAMNGEVLDMVQRSDAKALGFAQHCFKRQHDVAEKDGFSARLLGVVAGGKRQHVGGFVRATIEAVEPAHRRVIAQRDADAGGSVSCE